MDTAAAHPRRGFAAHSYWPRVGGLALGFLTLASVFYQLGSPWWVWLGAALHGFVWPHVAWLIARRSHDALAAERRNLLVDHFAGGLWIVAMAFNVLPSVLMATLMAMDSVIAGGRRALARGLAAHAAGIGVGLLVYGVHWQPASTMLQVWACLPLLVSHPIVVGQIAHRALQKLNEQRAHMAHLSLHDPLSDLYNRRHLDACIRSEFQRFQRTGAPATLVLMDFDHFKLLNDTLGHQAGDEAIRRFAERLRKGLRGADTPGRYGGEEFIALLPHTRAQEAGGLMQRLQASLRADPLLPGRPMTVSVGVAELTAELASPEAWVRLADQMLYRAKDMGRNRVVMAGHEPAPPQDQPSPATDSGAAGVQLPVEARILSGLVQGDIAAALFDPSDRLVWSNEGFHRLYGVPMTVRTFADIVRHCHEHQVGAKVQTNDLDAWLAAADAKRRSKTHRSFVIDFCDGRLFRIEEISMGDGWLLDLWLPHWEQGADGANAVHRLMRDVA